MNFYEKLTNPENPFIIAEIGSNHNGDLSKAKQMIDVAVEAGCDAVKFQSWDYDSLFSQSILDQHTDMVAEGVDAKGLEEIQKKLALSSSRSPDESAKTTDPSLNPGEIVPVMVSA